MVAVVTGAAIGLPLRVSRWLVLCGGCSVVVVVMLVLTLLAMAVAQALAALVEPHGFVLLFTAVYLALWLSAAFLFGRAARV